MMNEIERRLLIKARRLIRDHREDCVCHALQEACSRLDGGGLSLHTPEYVACRRLTGYIHAMLEMHTYLEDWQDAHGIEHYERWDEEQVRTRIDWISWMLGEL